MRLMLTETPLGELLQPLQIEAIHTAAGLLLESALDDVAHLTGGGDFTETERWNFVPPRFLARYNCSFALKFHLCLVMVYWRMFSPTPERLACVGEEMACEAIVREAERILADYFIADGRGLDETDPRQDTISGVAEEMFEDTDFELLWETERDGLEHVMAALGSPPARLRFREWFLSFGSDYSVHPYLAFEAHLARQETPEPGG